jgi:hypothetical protein
MRTWKLFNHDDIEHQDMLDKFLLTPNLPKFVSSREDIKIDELRKHPASEYYMLVDDTTGDMIGGCGFYVLKDENGILYCKSPYRLFITEHGNGAYSHNRKSWENITDAWHAKWSHIPFLATVNEGNEVMIPFEHKTIPRHCSRLDPNSRYVKLQKSFHMHPTLVWEMYTWQYVYYTPNYVGFKRREKPIDPDVKKMIEETWANGHWFGSNGRTSLE